MADRSVVVFLTSKGKEIVAEDVDKSRGKRGSEVYAEKEEG